MQSALPEFMKWFLNVFETVFLAGIFGLIVAFLILSFNEATASFYQFFWVIPLAVALVIAVASIFQAQRLSHFIQHRFLSKQNLNELNIELYYVSTILKIRNKGKKEGVNDG